MTTKIFSLNDLFFKMGMCLDRIIELMHSTYSTEISERLEDLKESTKFGKIYLKNLYKIVEDFNKYYKTIQKRIDEYDEKKKNNPNYFISIKDMESLVQMFDEYEAPQILTLLNLVWKNPSCDNEDRENAHKTCVIYQQLYLKYENSLDQLKLKQSSLNHIHMKGFVLPKI